MEETTAIPPGVEHSALRGEQGPVHKESDEKIALDQIHAVMALVGEPLYDEQGPIPNFSPCRDFDEQDQYIPMFPEEREARGGAYRRSMKVIDARGQDPPGSDEEFMRGIDSPSPEGSKLFEGYY